MCTDHSADSRVSESALTAMGAVSAGSLPIFEGPVDTAHQRSLLRRIHGRRTLRAIPARSPSRREAFVHSTRPRCHGGVHPGQTAQGHRTLSLPPLLIQQEIMQSAAVAVGGKTRVSCSRPPTGRQADGFGWLMVSAGAGAAALLRRLPLTSSPCLFLARCFTYSTSRRSC